MVLPFPYLSSALQAQYLSVFAVSKGSCKTKVEFMISIYSYVSSCEHVYNEASSKYIYYITIYILTLFSFQLEYHWIVQKIKFFEKVFRFYFIHACIRMAQKWQYTIVIYGKT